MIVFLHFSRPQHGAVCPVLFNLLLLYEETGIRLFEECPEIPFIGIVVLVIDETFVFLNNRAIG